MNKSFIPGVLIATCLITNAVFFGSQPTEGKKPRPAKKKSEGAKHDDKDVEQGKPNRLLPKPVPPEDLLTVEETLGVVFWQEYGTPRRTFYARAHPDAKDVLYRVLENDELRKFHGGAWECLGYIGDKPHIKRIEEKLEEFKSIQRTLTHEERQTLRAIFNSLGILCSRKVEGAQALADRIMKLSYWRDAEFRWDANSSRENPLHDMVTFLMFGYSLSLDPQIGAKSTTIIEQLDNSEEKATAKKISARKRLLLRHGWNSRAYEEKVVPYKRRRQFALWFNGDLQNPQPLTPSISQRQKAARLGEQEDQQRRKSANDTILKDPAARLRAIAEEFGLNAEGKLSYLSLHRDEINNKTLTLLAAAPRLRYLGIVSTKKVTDDGLKHLKPLRHLDHLAFSRTPNITDQGLNVVGELQTLTRLDLLYLPQITDDGLKHLKPLKKLEHLSLDNLSVTDEGLKHLNALTNLEFLELYQGGITGGVTDEGLEHLAELQNLKELRISSRTIKGSGLKHLQKLKNLEKLSLRGMPLGDEDLEHLQKCRNLKKLSIAAATTIDAPPLYSNNALSRLKKALPDTEITAGRRYRRPRR